MLGRREVLGAFAAPAFAPLLGAAPLRFSAASPTWAARLAALASHDGSPDDVAADESFWFEVQQAFSADRSLINLNNGGVSPAPVPVQDALKRHLDYSNTAPVYTMWRILQPQKEAVRRELAKLFGCDAEEIAITRNASESLQTCQFGIDLEPGDEVLTTNQDYPRMLTTFEQRVRREGIVLRKVSIPTPAEDPREVVRAFEGGLTDRTRLILVCHVINLTGQILPVRDVVRLGRAHGVPVVVDGAHAFAHFPFEQKDLECDYYATSLHKWLFAPFGTGMLYVKRDKIGGLWPLMAAGEKLDDDIRKFEEIGTHPVPNIIAISDAIAFHRGIGAERKAARLVYLRDRWARRLVENDRIRLHTSLKPGLACGIACVELDGIDSAELVGYLFKEHKILVTPIRHDEFQGIRVSPSVYTQIEEIDRFADVLETVARDGLPA